MTTTVTTTTNTIDATTRRVPPLGGVNATVLGIELRRMLRNRRTIIFTLVFPAALLLSFGGQDGWTTPAGLGNVAAYILVSMGLYGAALTAAAGGSMVALERSLGWSRQLRLTPAAPGRLHPDEDGRGAVHGRPGDRGGQRRRCSAGQGVDADAHLARVRGGDLVLHADLRRARACSWATSCPARTRCRSSAPDWRCSPSSAGCSSPSTSTPTSSAHIAYWTPMYGVAEIARSPSTRELPWYAVVNAVVWFAVFVAGAAWRMSKDTARV